MRITYTIIIGIIFVIDRLKEVCCKNDDSGGIGQGQQIHRRRLFNFFNVV